MYGFKAFLAPQRASMLKSNMLSLDFDVFLLNNDERISFIMSGFALFGFIEQFKISSRKLCAFIAKCAQIMGAHRLTYHNFIHVTDIFQFLMVHNIGVLLHACHGT